MRVEEAGGGEIRLEMEEHEAELFRSLLIEMQTFLEVAHEGDPVTERLFPKAYEGNGDEEKYRDMTEEDLYKAKRETVRQARDMLGELGAVNVTLHSDQTDAWPQPLPRTRESHEAAGTAFRPWAILTWKLTGWKDPAVRD